jgi:hypothetical protein
MRKIFWSQTDYDEKDLSKVIYDLYLVAKKIKGQDADIYEVLDYNIDYYASNKYFPSNDILKTQFKDFKFIENKFKDSNEYKNYIKDKLALFNDKVRKDRTLVFLDEPDNIKRIGILDELLKIEIGITNAEKDLEDVTKYDYKKMYDKRISIGEGPRTNVEDIDALIGGFTSGKLMVIAAPQKCFKTTFAINMSYIGIMEYESPNNTLILSLELPGDEWYWKTIIRHSYKFNYNINIKSILKGLLTDDEKLKLFEVVEDFNNNKKHELFILDGSQIQLESLLSFKQQIANYIEKNNIKTIYIDYIQIFKNYRIKGYNNPLDMLNDIVGMFHLLEVQYGVRVAMLSQINREGQKKGDSNEGEMKAYHLNEVSNLEKYAYYLIILWTDEDLKRTNQLKFQLLYHRDGQTIAKPKFTWVLPQYFLIGKNSEYSFDKMINSKNIEQRSEGSETVELDLFND